MGHTHTDSHTDAVELRGDRTTDPTQAKVLEHAQRAIDRCVRRLTEASQDRQPTPRTAGLVDHND